MPERRIFFFDLDGTLLDHKTRSFPESTREALRLLKSRGHLLYLNTSRSVNEMANARPHLSGEILDGYILSGGAVTVDGERTVETVYADSQDIAPAMDYLEREGIAAR